MEVYNENQPLTTRLGVTIKDVLIYDDEEISSTEIDTLTTREATATAVKNEKTSQLYMVNSMTLKSSKS